MTIFQRTSNNRSGRRLKPSIFFGGGILLLVIFIQLLAPHFLPDFFTGLFRPFWRLEFSVTAGSLKSPEALLMENENLVNKLAEDDIRMSTIKSIEIENAELKALLGRPASTTKIQNSKVLAAVLQKPPLSSYGDIVIDVGRDFNIATGSAVYANGDILIGRVSDVLGQTSKVRLLSFPGEKYDILIGAHHEQATAIGRGGGQYSAELPRSANISEGDFVIAPSFNDKPFGIVSGIISDQVNPFETVIFAPPINIYSLRWVLIEKKKHE